MIKKPMRKILSAFKIQVIKTSSLKKLVNNERKIKGKHQEIAKLKKQISREKAAIKLVKKSSVTDYDQRLRKLRIENFFLQEREKENRIEIQRLQNLLHVQQTKILESLIQIMQKNKSAISNVES